MKERTWLGILLSFAAPCRGKMAASVVLAILSVAGGFVPYLGVYQIIRLFLERQACWEGILFWCGVCLAGYAVKVAGYALSTTLAHVSAYTILEGLRLRAADQLMGAPLGEVESRPIGAMKSTIVDRIEDVEPPLAHMIPELSSNLLLPLVVVIAMFSIDWRMGLALLVTIPVALIPMAFGMRSYNKNYAAYMAANAHVNSVIVEYVEGIQVVKAFSQGQRSYEKFARAVSSFKDFTMDWFRCTWASMNLCLSILPTTLLGTLPAGVALYQAEVLDRIFAAHGFGRDSAVLDCACGIGTQALGLAALGYRVTGSDISPGALAEARERARDAGLPLELREADFRRLPELVGGSYDIVIAMDNALPHLMSSAELAKAVGSIAGVTRPGGLFAASIRDYDALLDAVCAGETEVALQDADRAERAAEVFSASPYAALAALEIGDDGAVTITPAGTGSADAFDSAAKELVESAVYTESNELETAAALYRAVSSGCTYAESEENSLYRMIVEKEGGCAEFAAAYQGLEGVVYNAGYPVALEVKVRLVPLAVPLIGGVGVHDVAQRAPVEGQDELAAHLDMPAL